MKKFIIIIMGVLLINSMNAQNYELWGMTEWGGSSSKGVIFKTDTSGNNYSLQHNFASSPDIGAKPTGNLIQTTTGKIYGLASAGASSGDGAIFEFDTATSTYAVKYEFGSSNNGRDPRGSLMEASNGKLYGTTSTGGAGTVGYGGGVLFEYDPATSTYTNKFSFGVGGNTLGYYPYSTLVQGSNGKLYGTTTTGGANGKGSIFEYDIALDTLVFVFDFVGNKSTGSSPQEGLMLASNGKLYGLTKDGGQYSHGALYEYNTTTNVFTKKADFHGYTKGDSPFGRLMEGSNGKLYGLASDGGTAGKGALFVYDTTAFALTKLVDFDGATKGKRPMGDLVEFANGKLYGMTYSGGTNSFGVLFEYDFINSTFTKKLDFDGTNGQYPQGGLLIINAGGSIPSAISNSEIEIQTNIYPNPTEGAITIKSAKAMQSVNIYNVIGKRVYYKEINNAHTQVDLSFLPEGMYLVDISFEDDRIIKKLILR